VEGDDLVAVETHLTQHLGGVFAEPRSRTPRRRQRHGRSVEPAGHAQLAGDRVLEGPPVTALLEVRAAQQLIRRLHHTEGETPLLRIVEPLVLALVGEACHQQAVELGGVLDAAGAGLETLVEELGNVEEGCEHLPVDVRPGDEHRRDVPVLARQQCVLQPATTLGLTAVDATHVRVEGELRLEDAGHHLLDRDLDLPALPSGVHLQDGRQRTDRGVRAGHVPVR